MKRTLPLLLLAGLLLAACDESDRTPVEYDTTPPFPPVGLYTIALDNSVEIRWIHNQEDDLDGYDVYRSNSYDGRYDRIGSTHDNVFVDRSASNAAKYYYAVAAYDFSDNASALSKDVAYATPRPEGLNVPLADRFVDPNRAGYDFSDYRVVYYDTDQTDVFVEFTTNRIPYLVVWKDSEIQDMGYTATLDDIAKSPTTGWSPTKDAQLILGHTYVIRTFDNHYAKMRITSLSQTGITFDWAYQLVANNPELVRILRMPPMPRQRHDSAGTTITNHGSL